MRCEILKVHFGQVVAAAGQVLSTHLSYHRIGAAVGTFVDTERLAKGNAGRIGELVEHGIVGTALEAVLMGRQLQLMVGVLTGAAEDSTEVVGMAADTADIVVEEQRIAEAVGRSHFRSYSRSPTIGCCSRPS